MLPFIAIMFALSRWAGKLVDTFGAKLPARGRPDRGRSRLRAFRVAVHRRQLLEHVLSGHCALGLGW
jgi:hypothetical protein